ncbi:hypothetical protein NL676_005669 [Syzygium grande]|nr:hypothetical protein NL676_005669 [Syzygium grande]
MATKARASRKLRAMMLRRDRSSKGNFKARDEPRNQLPTEAEEASTGELELRREGGDDAGGGTLTGGGSRRSGEGKVVEEEDGGGGENSIGNCAEQARFRANFPPLGLMRIRRRAGTKDGRRKKMRERAGSSGPYHMRRSEIDRVRSRPVPSAPIECGSDLQIRKLHSVLKLYNSPEITRANYLAPMQKLCGP